MSLASVVALAGCVAPAPAGDAPPGSPLPVRPGSPVTEDKPDAVFPDIGIPIAALRESESASLSIQRNRFDSDLPLGECT